MTAVFLIKGFGVIAMTLGALMVLSYVTRSPTSSTPSVVIGVVSLVLGAALFFLPGRRSDET